MKKSIIAMAAIAAAFTMASCDKEQPVSPIENHTAGMSVITASIENDLAKTTISSEDSKVYKVFWSAGDYMYVEDDDARDWAAKYTLDNSSADSTHGTFSWKEGDFFFPVGDYDEPAFEKGKKYVAMFDFVDLEAGAIWNTIQTNSTADRYIPMFAVTECTKKGTADFKFNNLGGFLRLTVKGSATIKSIKIIAKEALSGAIDDIVGNGLEGSEFIAYMGPVSENNKQYIVLDCGDGVQLSGEGTDFYISMPCNYNRYDGTTYGYTGVTITLTDIDDKTCEKNLKNEKGLVIERSKITTASFTASEFRSSPVDGEMREGNDNW